MEDWEKVWSKHELPQILKTVYHPYYIDILDDFFHKFLPKNPNLNFLEFGCAPGRWLHYFHQEFGYAVSGIDNAELGVELTKKNLDLLGVTADIHLGDVLMFNPVKQFDIVGSFGLIEHFDPTDQIIEKHLEVLKPGGWLIIEIPNLFSPFYLNLQKLIDASYIKIHKPLQLNSFRTLFEKLPLRILSCGYIGVVNLYLLGIAPEQKLAWWIVRNCQMVIDKLVRIFGLKQESSLFSPYMILIAKKVDAAA